MGNYKFGWHNFYEEARQLHIAIRDFLTIPNFGREKVNRAALSLKRMLEDMILSPGEDNPPKEEEDGDH